MSTRELPRYKCHKTVWALKIANIHDEDDRWIITPDDQDYAAFSIMKADWVNKPPMHIGGYYVVYRDGYKSYSPAKEFEDGYTRI